MTGRKNLRWFHAGTKALELVLDGDLVVDSYLCPICFRPIHISDAETQLRVEHAPQKSLSKLSGLPGRSVALTCVDCNEGAGRHLERHLKTTEDFLDAKAEGKQRVELIVGNVRTVANFHIGDNGQMVLSNLDRNSTKQKVASGLAFEDAANSDGTFKVNTTIGSNRHSDIAWLKSAYVAVFAAFGYAFIFQPQLEIVREQIAFPKRELIGRFRFEQLDAGRDRLGIRVVHEPSDLACIQVFMGRHVIFLPSPWTDVDIYQQLDRLTSTTANYPTPTRHTDIEWPTCPAHRCDDGNVVFQGHVDTRDDDPELWE